MNYKCLKSDFEIVTKKINAIGKKLNKHNIVWNFEKVSENIEKVNIYENNIKQGTTLLEAVTYNFEMDKLKLGDYEVIAVLDHVALLNNKNLIYIVKKGIKLDKKYKTIKSNCEHCNINRKRNKTVLLQDIKGNIIQIGTTCLKDFTGIEGIDVIKNYTDIEDIIIKYSGMSVNDTYIKNTKFVNTKEYLGNCIKEIKENGYIKEETKENAWNNLKINKIEKIFLNEAEKVIKYFKNMKIKNNDFLENIKLNVTEEYTRKSGFVAYSYIAMQEQIEKENKEKIRQEENKKSNYIGNIKDKIEIKVTVVNSFRYETEYGINYINIFKDAQGNIYKWNTSKFFKNDKKMILAGTIKAHEKYDGQKQNVLTRCTEIKNNRNEIVIEELKELNKTKYTNIQLIVDKDEEIGYIKVITKNHDKIYYDFEHYNFECKKGIKGIKKIKEDIENMEDKINDIINNKYDECLLIHFVNRKIYELNI